MLIGGLGVILNIVRGSNIRRNYSKEYLLKNQNNKI